MNKKFEYIKEASPFGSLRQIPEDEVTHTKFFGENIARVRNVFKNGESHSTIIDDSGFQREFEWALNLYEGYLKSLPLYPLSVQPSEEWIQRKEYEEGVDFKFSYEEISQDRYFQTYITSSSHPLSAIPIEKKGDDLLASQNHPQPLDSVATLACTEGNSIKQFGQIITKEGEGERFVAFFENIEGLTAEADTENGARERLVRGLKTIINRLPKWVDSLKQSPENSGEYVVRHKETKEIDFAYYHKGAGWNTNTTEIVGHIEWLQEFMPNSDKNVQVNNSQ